MAFQKVVDTAEIDMIFSQNGVTVQNTFYAKLPGGYTLTDLEAMADRIDSQWNSTWKVRQNADTTYLRTEVRGLAEENDHVATDSTSTGPGTHIGGALPNNATFAIKKESGLTGRSARGRCYWIGLAASELTSADENELESVYVALLVAAVDDIREAIETVGTWEAVLVSRFANGVARSEGKTFEWNSSSNVDARIDTQRRRLN